VNDYQPDPPRDPIDFILLSNVGAEPRFDPVTADFLYAGYNDLKQRCLAGSLVEMRSLGREVPWVYRFDFRTRGLGKAADGQVVEVDEHTVVVRFMPDCLRHTDRFQMIQYAGPREPAPWHPNICPRTGAVCVEVYPGETVLEIVESLHDLIRWRIRQLRDDDALNKDACAYGRTFIDGPLDDRPLFGGSAWTLQLEAAEDTP
jgi:hypothetical protein